MQVPKYLPPACHEANTYKLHYNVIKFCMRYQPHVIIEHSQDLFVAY